MIQMSVINVSAMVSLKHALIFVKLSGLNGRLGHRLELVHQENVPPGCFESRK